MKQFCSLKDIASAAGVSTALVSYVLNGKLSAKIRPETATRIRNIAADLNYIPNHMARNLKNERTLTMGLVMADISNFYYSNLARIIEDECTRTGYNLIFGNADEHAGKFKEVVDFFIRRQVDGLILATPCGAEPQLKFLNKLKIPFIGIDRYFSSLKDVNTITIDNYKASHDVATHLFAEGFMNPALVAIDSELEHLKDRVTGFEDGIKKLLEIQPNIFCISEQSLPLDLEPVMLWCLEQLRVDSFYFTTSKIALEGLAILIKHKVNVPQCVGVVCFDETDAYKLFPVSITYVKQPLQEVGGLAVSTLLNLIKHKDEKYTLRLEAKLVMGASSQKRSNRKEARAFLEKNNLND